MKNRIALFLAALLLVVVCHSARATVFGECDIRGIVAAALPSHVIVAGDRGWAGGVMGNADANYTFCDTNSAFFVIEPREKADPETVEQVASRIRERIIETFHFPVEKPSSLWMTHQPEGTTKETYSEAYLHTFPENNDRTKVSLYITVQAVRVGDQRYGVTVNYIWRGP